MYSKYVKRLIDIVFSIILLVILSPLMVIVAILIRRDGGPALFIQERSGKYGKIFKLYKFRSMTPSNDVRDFKKENEITKIGQFIRDTSIDEIPQLINILKGDMSFIGPRPWIIDYSTYFNYNQKKRLNVLPGITGLAQCSGRNNISIQEKIQYDIEYVDNVSFLMDVYVFVKTIKAVLVKDGAVSSKFSIKNELDELEDQTSRIMVVR